MTGPYSWVPFVGMTRNVRKRGWLLALLCGWLAALALVTSTALDVALGDHLSAIIEGVGVVALWVAYLGLSRLARANQDLLGFLRGRVTPLQPQADGASKRWVPGAYGVLATMRDRAGHPVSVVITTAAAMAGDPGSTDTAAS